MVATDLNLTVETLKPKDDLESGLAKKVNGRQPPTALKYLKSYSAEICRVFFNANILRKVFEILNWKSF